MQAEIIPRAKDVNGVYRSLPPVILTAEKLAENYSLSLNKAAKQLGVSETALKRCEPAFPTPL